MNSLNRFSLKITGLLLLITLISISMIINAQNPGFQVTEVGMTAPVGINTTQIVYFTNTNFQQQSVFYEGEQFYIVINLAQVFPGQPVYLTITLSGPPGTETIYQGAVNGGYIYYGELEIVPPIYNGATYTAYVTACLVVNNAITSDCVSGSASYIEEDHPPAKIISAPAIFNSNGQSVTTLIGNNTYTLTVTIANTGYITYTYNVAVSDSAGLISAQPMQVTVPAQGQAQVNMQFQVSSPTEPVSDEITVSVYGNGHLDDSSTISVTVYPSRPGPFALVGVSSTTLHEGESSTIVVTLQNTGYTASDITVSASSNIAPAVTATASSSQVGYNGELTVTLQLTPNVAGNGVIMLTVTYSSPYMSTTYTDTFQINVTVLAHLVVNLVSTSGEEVSGVATINGQQTNSLWVEPGTYEITVPGTINVGSGERYVFSQWSNGYGSSNVIEVTVTNSMTLTAYYNMQYYVSISDPVTGKSVSGWFNAGSTVNLPSVPQYINYNNGSRLYFEGWSCGYPASTTSIVVNSPISCESQWAMQYEVIVEDVVNGLFGSSSKVVAMEWVNSGSSYEVNALNYEPNNTNPLMPLTYSHAVVISGGSSSSVNSPMASFNVYGPTTVEFVWNTNPIRAIGLGIGAALLGLGVVFRDRVKYFTTIIVRRTTTVIRSGKSEGAGTGVGTRVYTAEDGTRVYAQSTGELPVKPLEEGGTVVKSTESQQQGAVGETVVRKEQGEEQNKEGG